MLDWKDGLEIGISKHLKIQNTISVKHTGSYIKQWVSIATTAYNNLNLIEFSEKEVLFVEDISKHRKIIIAYKFLTLIKRVNSHNADWKPKRAIIQNGGSLTNESQERVTSEKRTQSLWVGKVFEYENKGIRL